MRRTELHQNKDKKKVAEYKLKKNNTSLLLYGNLCETEILSQSSLTIYRKNSVESKDTAQTTYNLALQQKKFHYFF